MNVGVLALQGGFAEHRQALRKVGVASSEIRKQEDLAADIDALILPGGESTVIGRLLDETGLFDPIQKLIEGGLPVWGTCAGMILLAKHLEGSRRTYFASMDIAVKRNAFGRQLGSFHTKASFRGVGEIPMTFIRAPYIQTIGEGATTLATIDNHIVAAEQGKMLVTAFHPELNEDLGVLEYFLKKV